GGGGGRGTAAPGGAPVSPASMPASPGSAVSPAPAAGRSAPDTISTGRSRSPRTSALAVNTSARGPAAGTQTRAPPGAASRAVTSAAAGPSPASRRAVHGVTSGPPTASRTSGRVQSTPTDPY